MTERFSAFLLAPFLGGTLLISVAAADDPSDTPPPPPIPQEGVDVLARGPVHEAFAEPSGIQPQPSPLVTKPPPKPVNELPPEQRPEGDNVQWIPGYWAWDQEQSDYLWVSGFWRIPPPGLQWVPGTWQEVEGGWHWVAGFWAPPNQEQFQYLPPPPPSLDQGPSTPAPQANSVYVPGCWVHQEARYGWRPGFWSAYRPGWIWMPAHYVWTPSGCLFVEGYWDHPLEARGLLFAPVRLARRLLTTPRWAYTPQFVVRPDSLIGALFVQPALSHYYFGDYFGARYARAGFVPWIDYRVGRSGYDPNFNYYRLAFAQHGTWERGLRELYGARLRGEVAPPPRTWGQQKESLQTLTSRRIQNEVLNKNINLTHLQNLSVLTPLSQIHNTRVTNLSTLAHGVGREASVPAFSGHVLKLQDVPREQRLQAQRVATQFHAAAQQRGKVEAGILAAGPPVRVTHNPRHAKFTLPPMPRAGAARPVERPSERPVAPPGQRPRPTVTVPPHRMVPPAPTLPRHEERPIPRHEPPKPSAPPRHIAPPPPTPKKELPHKKN